MAIEGQLGHLEGIGVGLVKLGQLAEVQENRSSALAYYQQALAILEQLGMPLAQKVRQMIADLEGEEPMAPDSVQAALDRARVSAARGDFGAAVAAQEEAVALVRSGGEDREALVALSVLLYNLAGYYQDAGRYDDAVPALEEVVALDERTGHPDLESDRHALQEARRLAAMSPAEREHEALQAGMDDDALPIPLEALPPELRARLEAVGGEIARLSPEERAELEGRLQALAQHLAAMDPQERAEWEAAARAAARRDQIESLADQARDGAIAALRGEIEREPLAQDIEQVAAQAAEGEEPGSPWDELAAYLRAVVALLRGEPLPGVPAAYAAHLAAVQAERA